MHQTRAFIILHNLSRELPSRRNEWAPLLFRNRHPFVPIEDGEKDQHSRHAIAYSFQEGEYFDEIGLPRAIGANEQVHVSEAQILDRDDALEAFDAYRSEFRHIDLTVAQRWSVREFSWGKHIHD